MGERFDAWEKINRNEINVVVGARSAIFTPLDNIGIIVVDEEHETSYKSEMSPRYDAREVAEHICRQEGAVLVLASATPSVGGRLDTTSDYNMYFRIGGGTNRGFVFKNGSNTLFQIEGSGQVRTNSKIIVKGYDALTRENEGHKNNATGINADKLDDLHATDFLRRNATTDTNGEIVFTTTNKGIKFADNSGLVSNNGIAIKTSTSSGNNFKVVDETNSVIFNLNKNSIIYNGQPIWHKGHQGHGSTLDADTLDGRHADQFAQANHIHDDRYIRHLLQFRCAYIYLIDSMYYYAIYKLLLHR
jgi:hypothetical protein